MFKKNGFVCVVSLLCGCTIALGMQQAVINGEENVACMEFIAGAQQELAPAPLIREKALRNLLIPSVVAQSKDPFDVFIFMDSVIGVDLSVVTYNRDDGIEDFTFDDIAKIVMQHWISDRTFWPELRKAQIKAYVAAFAVAQSEGNNGSRKN